MAKYRAFTVAYDKQGEWLANVSEVFEALSKRDAEKRFQEKAKNIYPSSY